MKNKIPYFETISDYFRHFDIELDQGLNFTIHQLSILENGQLRPLNAFRTGYFAFLLIEKGAGSYSIDEHWFELKKHSFYFTSPSHLKSFSIEKAWKGFILTFDEPFLTEHFHISIKEEFPFLFEESIPVMYLPNDFFEEMRELFMLVSKDYDRSSLHKKEILASQLQTILYKTKSYLNTHQAKVDVIGRPAEIAQTFKSLLSENIKQVISQRNPRLWNVQEIADVMSIHPNYLSSIVKQVTGKSVKKWMNEKLISETKALLTKTNMTNAEIAASFGFSDASSFSRFFKKETSTSPSDYRKS
ncbi:MAG: helix-turn-helix transcriptional regulator [Bacteroidota bacterium]